MIFLSCLFERTKEKELQSLTNLGMSNAGNTFQWALIDGLNGNMDVPVSIYNALPVGTFPCQFKKLFLRTSSWSYQGSQNVEIGCINLPFIKQFMRFLKAKQLILKMKDKQILLYSTYLPFLQAVQKLDSSYHVTLVVADLPEYYDLVETSYLHKWFRKQNNRKILTALKRVDDFVLLTEQMKTPLAVGERPYVVVEGICGVGSEETPLLVNDKKVIFYAGTLHYQYGIKTLLKAFSLIDDPAYELWICGAGEAEKEIRSCAKQDLRIHFYGYVEKAESLRLQKLATVLVNPRTNEGEYTKYSFPSKTIEYMSSGIPVVMYKLDGIPPDYDPYLYYVGEDTSAQALCTRLKEVCELPDQVRLKFGEAARDFVRQEKGCLVQAKKILDMIGQGGKRS